MNALRPILTGTQYGGITLGFIAFVIYGSLVPLHFQPIPFDTAWQRFTMAFSRRIAVEQPSDWLANILLFIPLGFVMMGWRRVDRQGVALRTVLWVVPFCTILSALLEIVRLWFPPRHTSPNDVVAETMGGMIGIGVWLAAGQRMTDAVRRVWSIYAVRNWPLRLMPAYLALLVFIHGMPFDLTLSPTMLRNKYRNPDRLIRPIPFTLAHDEPLDLAKKAIVNTAWFFPAGLLLAGMPGAGWRRRGAGWKVLGIGFLMAATIEVMQLFVVSRYFDTTDIITGTAAAWLGWRIMRAWQESDKTPRRFQDGLRGTLGLFWMIVLIFFHWEPFDFRSDPRFIAERWEQLSFISYHGYHARDYMHLTNDMLRKALLFLPLGLLLSFRSGTRFDRLVTTGVAVLLSLALEIGEFFLQHQQRPGISDLIVEPFGAWLGCLAVGRLREFKERTMNERLPESELVGPAENVP